jgi:predicted nucleic acid-binding protein
MTELTQARTTATTGSRGDGSAPGDMAVGQWTVVDASVLAVALVDDGPDGDRTRDALRGRRLVAPALVDLEIMAIWHRGTAAGAIPARRVDLAMDDLSRLPVERVAPARVLPLCWDLLTAVTPVDAAYLALADVLDAPLLTADTRLASRRPAGVRVELLG